MRAESSDPHPQLTLCDQAQTLPTCAPMTVVAAAWSRTAVDAAAAAAAPGCSSRATAAGRPAGGVPRLLPSTPGSCAASTAAGSGTALAGRLAAAPSLALPLDLPADLGGRPAAPRPPPAVAAAAAGMALPSARATDASTGTAVSPAHSICCSSRCVLPPFMLAIRASLPTCHRFPGGAIASSATACAPAGSATVLRWAGEDRWLDGRCGRSCCCCSSQWACRGPLPGVPVAGPGAPIPAKAVGWLHTGRWCPMGAPDVAVNTGPLLSPCCRCRLLACSAASSGCPAPSSSSSSSCSCCCCRCCCGAGGGGCSWARLLDGRLRLSRGDGRRAAGGAVSPWQAAPVAAPAGVSSTVFSAGIGPHLPAATSLAEDTGLQPPPWPACARCCRPAAVPATSASPKKNGSAGLPSQASSAAVGSLTRRSKQVISLWLSVCLLCPPDACDG